ncbi:MAG: hypothetical protein V4560_07165 [Bacteroidota bacterium]
MKPNQEQREIIEDILGSVSKYRETYEELYDHILCALDAVPNEVPFIDALHHIIENELGGGSGIYKIEKKYEKTATKEIVKRYLQYFGQYLLSPFILVAFALTGMLYWVIKEGMISPDRIVLLCFASNAIVMKVREKWINKTINLYGKNSVIKIVYPYIGMLPMLLSAGVGLIYMIVNGLFIFPYFDSRLYISLAVFFINLVNMLAYYRLCKDEFKVITTT